VTPVIDDTVTGTSDWAVPALPSSPALLFPQQSTAPVERVAQAKSVPTLTDVALVIEDTAPGESDWVVPPLPRSPSVLPPQQSIEPVARRAQALSAPALT
jgi:hypothetical protein